MSESHEIILKGCHPEPLMSYLKSLGILRLVSEQADPDATARWRNDEFVLRSKFDEEELIDFFLNKYCPTPIAGPWAGGSGFFEKDNQKAVQKIIESDTKRLAKYRKTIKCIQKILEEENISKKPNNEQKITLLKCYRHKSPDEFVQWMDAAMAIQMEGQSFAPLLGTGGNDGRLDFTQNFMQRILEVGISAKKTPEKSWLFLKTAIFNVPTSNLIKAPIGQFSPGQVGGPNATQGMEGFSIINPWDYILMIEGTLFFAGAIVRRMGTNQREKGAFPFTVRSRSIGEGAVTQDELKNTRGEIWLPVWEHFVNKKELEVLFSEGRAELSGRVVNNTVDFARAIATLGVDRGIVSFTRYGFLMRSGKAYLANAMERFIVPQQKRESVDILHEIDFWLDQLRRACSSDNIPPRFKSALRLIETAIYDYCKYGGTENITEVLTSLGNAELHLSVTQGPCRPLSGLSPKWIDATFDNTPENKLALSLSGIFDNSNKIGNIRTNLEPVNERGNSWKEKGGQVVWDSTEVTKNLVSVLERRMMDGIRFGTDSLPIQYRYPANLKSITLFINQEVDDKRLEELLWGYILINHRTSYPKIKYNISSSFPIPRVYALLKLLFLPCNIIPHWNVESQNYYWQFTKNINEGIHIPSELRILSLLRSDRLSEACQVAYRRLMVSGLHPLPGSLSSGYWRANDWKSELSIDTTRLAAALLFPIGNKDLNKIINLVTRPIIEKEGAEVS